VTLVYSEFAKRSRNGVTVTLTAEQVDLAYDVAKRRNGIHRANNRADGNVNGQSLAVDIDGAMAELAVCVAYNKPWENAFVSLERWDNERRMLHDVAHLEVKSTRHPNGCLLVQKQFSDEPPYVLVITARAPEFRLAGWLYGWEVKQAKFWRTDVPRPCYMAPQNALRPMDTL